MTNSVGMISFTLLLVSGYAIRISELPHWVPLPPLVEEVESRNYVLMSDEPVVLPCHATGHPKPTILWFKDGKKIEESDNFKITSDGSLKITSQGLFNLSFTLRTNECLQERGAYLNYTIIFAGSTKFIYSNPIH